MANERLRPHYQILKGIRFPPMFSSVLLKEVFAYKPKPEDVFIVTYPKCGTTWMQTVALYIFRKGKELEDYNNFFKMCPFIDCSGNEGINKMPRPGAFKTHLPYNYIPYAPDAKYVYLLRNPKDCCVSLYYHTTRSPGYGYWDGTFNDFFELFMGGEVEYNDYFDHLMSWYPHRNDRQVFFTTYEEMKKDLKTVVLKLSAFLGKEYIDTIERDNNVLNNVLQFSSFEYMKKNASELYDFRNISEEKHKFLDLYEGEKYMFEYCRSLNPPDDTGLEFIRKGIVGDWKNHLSIDQSERLHTKFVERTRGTEVLDMYKSIM